MTGGLENGVASLVGRSLQDTDSPTIGFCAHASVQGNEDLVGGQSGVVHYSGAEALSSSPKSRRTLPSSAARDEAAAAPLCRLHSHFLLVDSGSADGQSGERLLRRQLERYLCEHDISGDGVKTPMVLLVINGDVESLLSVIEALETPTPSESSSGSARPVLVMADSGAQLKTSSTIRNDNSCRIPKGGRRSIARKRRCCYRGSSSSARSQGQMRHCHFLSSRCEREKMSDMTTWPSYCKGPCRTTAATENVFFSRSHGASHSFCETFSRSRMARDC